MILFYSFKILFVGKEHLVYNPVCFIVASGNLSHWKELPTGPSGGMGRGTMGCPPGMPGSRLKPEGAVWGSRGNNGSWEEGGGHAGWEEGVGAKWPEGAASWAKTKSAGIGTPLWDSDMDSWGHKQGPKQLTKDVIWNSKQFRVLVDMGYKVGINISFLL